MARVVIGVETTFEGTDQFYLVEPLLPEGDRPKGLDPAKQKYVKMSEQAIEQCEPLDAEERKKQMEALGEAVYQLLHDHPVFQTQIEPQLTINQNHLSPLYLLLKGDQQRVVDFPWEAIHTPDAGFLAQNRNFSVARAEPSVGDKEPWVFKSPLRMMAVLGVNDGAVPNPSGSGQYEALHQALEESGLEYRLKVLSCEKALVTRINRAGHRLADGRLEAEFLRNGNALLHSMASFKPHILHFFCHGRAGVPAVLEVATKLSWESGARGEDITLDALQLKQSGDPDNDLLLVTLDCCEGARPAAGNHVLSMAFAQTLVATGVPAVVGMRRAIPTDFADKFSELFYRHLFKDLKDCVDDARKNGEAEVHWACALYDLRKSLYSQGGKVPCLLWTLPVVHTRLAPFKVSVDTGEPEASKLLAKMQALTRAEQALKDAPKPLVERIAHERKKVDKELQSQSRR